jgi:subtilase family serine protease
MNPKKRAACEIRQSMELLEPRQFLSTSTNPTITPSIVIDAAATSSSSISGYTPAEIKSAYGISSISFSGVTGTGAGQTIAIVDAYSDANIASDLAVFDKEFGLATASLTQESATGSTTKLPAADAGWDGEISLDVEWAHAIAPQAKIVLVDASSDSLSNLMAAVKYARTITSVSVISMSWGSSEFSGETSYDKYFTTPSGHIGITFVAASGDEGASGGAEWPAASPKVLSVGGTTLSLTNTGTVSSETAWSDSSGGVSEYESTPTYQSSVSTTGRSVPDVSYDADPNTGFAVYDSVADDGSVGWQEVGGTSAGTPQWAALIAIADQGRVKNGLGTLDGATGTLPAIYSIYSNATSYVADFTDITSGSSELSGGSGFGGPGVGSGGGFGGPFGGRGRRSVEEVSASTGYDTLTGLGTPKAASLIAALSSMKVSSAAVTKTTTATAAKVTKTKASAAIEVNQSKSLLAPGVVGSATMQPIQLAETTIDVETMAASPAASSDTNRASKVSVNNASDALATSSGDQTASTVGASLQTLLADASMSAGLLISNAMKSVAEQAEARASQLGSSAAAIHQTFSDANTDFGAALIQFTDECAAIPGSEGQRKQASSPGTAIATAAIAADAVLLGYLHSKRKRSVAEADIFSDDTLI